MAWKRFLPDVELATAIQAIESGLTDGAIPTRSDLGIKKTPNEPWISSRSPDEHEVTANDEPSSDSSPDSEYENAETLNWDESVDTTAGATDGIGSLSTSWRGIGYMGPQTGNTLLRKLQSVSVLYLNHDEDFSQRSSPQPELPDHVLESSQLANKCIDWYFKYFHCAYPILHEGYFRAQLMGKTHT